MNKIYKEEDLNDETAATLVSDTLEKRIPLVDPYEKLEKTILPSGAVCALVDDNYFEADKIRSNNMKFSLKKNNRGTFTMTFLDGQKMEVLKDIETVHTLINYFDLFGAEHSQISTLVFYCLLQLMEGVEALETKMEYNDPVINEYVQIIFPKLYKDGFRMDFQEIAGFMEPIDEANCEVNKSDFSYTIPVEDGIGGISLKLHKGTILVAFLNSKKILHTSLFDLHFNIKNKTHFKTWMKCIIAVSLFETCGNNSLNRYQQIYKRMLLVIDDLFNEVTDGLRNKESFLCKIGSFNEDKLLKSEKV